jgi:putative intracellular protease/amidase
MQIVGVLLFQNFETLDVYGPVEALGRNTDKFTIKFYSLNGGMIGNAHGVNVLSEKLEVANNGLDIFIIPGAYGTRQEVNNEPLINLIKQIAEKSKFVLTVCTGAALLAKTGLLEHKNATTNKIAFDWVVTQSNLVNWIRKARWVVDGKYYTSAGVSAGIDMTLGFLGDIYGIDFARNIAKQMEFNWQEDRDFDLFSEVV